MLSQRVCQSVRPSVTPERNVTATEALLESLAASLQSLVAMQNSIVTGQNALQSWLQSVSQQQVAIHSSIEDLNTTVSKCESVPTSLGLATTPCPWDRVSVPATRFKLVMSPSATHSSVDFLGSGLARTEEIPRIIPLYLRRSKRLKEKLGRPQDIRSYAKHFKPRTSVLTSPRTRVTVTCDGSPQKMSLATLSGPGGTDKGLDFIPSQSQPSKSIPQLSGADRPSTNYSAYEDRQTHTDCLSDGTAGGREAHCGEAGPTGSNHRENTLLHNY